MASAGQPPLFSEQRSAQRNCENMNIRKAPRAMITSLIYHSSAIMLRFSCGVGQLVRFAIIGIMVYMAKDLVYWKRQPNKHKN